MKIIVCIKQVPSSKEITFDENTGIIKRDNNEVMMNPSDLYAIETALKLKEKNGGEVIAITMGPPSAEEVLKEALSLGVDETHLVSDRRFAGSDLLTTSHCISEAIKFIGNFDVVITGNESLDGATGQLSAEIAEWINSPILSNVENLIDSSENYIIAQRVIEDIIENVKVTLPAVLSINSKSFEPRFPNYIDLLRSEETEISVINLDNFEDKDEKNYGLKGAHSVVTRVFKKENSDAMPNFGALDGQGSAEIWNGNKEELSSKLNNKLKELKFI